MTAPSNWVNRAVTYRAYLFAPICSQARHHYYSIPCRTNKTRRIQLHHVTMQTAASQQVFRHHFLTFPHNFHCLSNFTSVISPNLRQRPFSCWFLYYRECRLKAPNFTPTPAHVTADLSLSRSSSRCLSLQRV